MFTTIAMIACVLGSDPERCEYKDIIIEQGEYEPLVMMPQKCMQLAQPLMAKWVMDEAAAGRFWRIGKWKCINRSELQKA